MHWWKKLNHSSSIFEMVARWYFYWQIYYLQCMCWPHLKWVIRSFICGLANSISLQFSQAIWKTLLDSLHFCLALCIFVNFHRLSLCSSFPNIQKRKKKQGKYFSPIPIYGRGVIRLCVWFYLSVCLCFGKLWITFEQMDQFVCVSVHLCVYPSVFWKIMNNFWKDGPILTKFSELVLLVPGSYWGGG